MLELKICCDTIDEINIYANAVSLHNLLGDLCNQLRTAQKYGTDADVVRVAANFFPDLCKAVEHCQGPY